MIFFGTNQLNISKFLPPQIILGTRKLWQIFPIKQKFSTKAPFFYSKKVFPKKLEDKNSKITSIFSYSARALIYASSLRAVTQTLITHLP